MRTWGQRHGLGKPKTQALTGDGGKIGKIGDVELTKILGFLIRPKKGETRTTSAHFISRLA